MLCSHGKTRWRAHDWESARIHKGTKEEGERGGKLEAEEEEEKEEDEDEEYEKEDEEEEEGEG